MADDIESVAKQTPAAARAAAKAAAVAGEKEVSVELVHGSYIGPGFSHDAPAQVGDILKMRSADAERMVASGAAKALS